jgi:hypothetical protein
MDDCDAAYRIVPRGTADKIRTELRDLARRSREGRLPHSYDLNDYNCTDWAIDLLRKYFPSNDIDFDLAGRPAKPKKLVEALVTNVYWQEGLPWIRPNS